MQKIAFQEQLQTTAWVDNTRYFSFRKDKKWHRIQRACFWLLKKIGAFSRDKEISYSYKTVAYDPSKVTEYVHRQANYILSRENRHPRYLYVGPQQFHELFNSEVARYMSFAPLSITDQYPAPEFAGLKIIVLPWMEGVLVVPEDK